MLTFTNVTLWSDCFFEEWLKHNEENEVAKQLHFCGWSECSKLNWYLSGLEQYQKWERGTGDLFSSGPHLSTHLGHFENTYINANTSKNTNTNTSKNTNTNTKRQIQGTCSSPLHICPHTWMTSPAKRKSDKKSESF